MDFVLRMEVLLNNNQCSGANTSFNFEDGCAGPEWHCLRRHPQLNLAPNLTSEFGPAADGYVFGVLGVGDADSQNGIDAIFYDADIDCVSFGNRYDISFSAKVVTASPTLPNPNDKLRLRVFALARPFIFPDCEGVGVPPQYQSLPLPVGPNDIIVDQIIEGDGNWIEFNVTKVLAPAFSTGPMAIVVYGEYESGGNFLLGVDDFQIEETECEANKCEEDFNLNSCAVNNNMGYVHVACQDVGYEWDLPVGSSAIVLNSTGETAIVNASPGEYRLTMLGDFGCLEERTYTIVEDCCAAENQCLPPTNISCGVNLQNEIVLSWDPVPSAAYYEIVVAANAVSCGCEPVVGPQLNFNSATNSVIVTGLGKPCFSFTIGSICDDGVVSDWTEPHCYNPQLSCYELLVEETDVVNRFQVNEPLNKSQEPRIFPNPSSGLVSIVGSNDFKLAEVAIYNTVGQLIESKNLIEQNEVVLDLLEGTYITKIVSTNGEIISKVVLVTN